jgi:hypothetical protein
MIVGMSNPDAEAARSEVARNAARERWERRGNPVVARSVQVVVTRADELTDSQRAAVEAAITGGGDTGD